MEACIRKNSAARLLAIFFAVLQALACACSSETAPVKTGIERSTFRFLPAEDSSGAIVALEGLPDSLDLGARQAKNQLEQVLQVWTGAVDFQTGSCTPTTGQQSMLGEVVVASDALNFVPRFPPVEGLTYTACADLRDLTELDPLVELQSDDWVKIAQSVWSMPSRSGEDQPQVVSLWPPFDAKERTVPANLLHIYVTFSEPMVRTDVAGKVRLLDEAGSQIVEPFVEIPHGLWDDSSQRLTLFFDPGRIKRGVGPHEVQGAVLQSGTKVRLQLDATLESMRGEPLGRSFEHWYAVAAEDRASPNPVHWKIVEPNAATAPLVLQFDEPLDPAQLGRMVSVESAPQAKGAMDGAIQISNDGTSWRFVPTDGWAPGNYLVIVDSRIEDLAGNSVHRLFDEARSEPGSRSRAATDRDQAGLETTRRRIELPFSFSG